MQIIKDSKIDFMNKSRFTILLSGALILAGIFSLIINNGPKLSIDFKGGTLIELQSENPQIKIGYIRKSFLNMNLGDISVQKFGGDDDYLVKIEKKDFQNKNFIRDIKDKLDKSLGADINFRRVENVGPKVSAELLRSGVIAILLSLAAMLFYIWIRFEWQFSLGAIVALLHDVLTVSYTHLTLPTNREV